MRISLWHRYLLAFSVSSKYLSIVLYCRRIEGAADLGNNDVTSERKGEEKNFAQSGFLLPSVLNRDCVNTNISSALWVVINFD